MRKYSQRLVLGDLAFNYIFVRNLLGLFAHQLLGFSSPASIFCPQPDARTGGQRFHNFRASVLYPLCSH